MLPDQSKKYSGSYNSKTLCKLPTGNTNTKAISCLNCKKQNKKNIVESVVSNWCTLDPSLNANELINNTTTYLTY